MTAGVKLTGSRFYVLNGAAARLQRLLIAWMLDLHSRQGYTERYTPFMVKAETLYAAGQLPKFYIVIIAYIIFYDIYLQYYLNSFDIDKNGFFNGDEITIEQKKAMQKLSSDTGRNFSFITGLFYSAI